MLRIKPLVMGIAAVAALSCVAVQSARADEFVYGYSYGDGNEALTLTFANGPTQTFSTAQSEITPGISNQGWWSGTFSNSTGNDNYFAGQLSGNDLRDYFTFDLSSIAGQGLVVTGATLDMTKFGCYSDTGRPFQTYDLWDVSTPAAVLNNESSSPNSSIWADLGSGKNYGSFPIAVDNTIDNNTLALGLNGNAISDINTFIGTGGNHYFSIGGDIPVVPEFGTLFGFCTIISGGGLTLLRRRIKSAG